MSLSVADVGRQKIEEEDPAPACKGEPSADADGGGSPPGAGVKAEGVGQPRGNAQLHCVPPPPLMAAPAV